VRSYLPPGVTFLARTFCPPASSLVCSISALSLTSLRLFSSFVVSSPFISSVRCITTQHCRDSSVQLLSRVQLFVTPWTTARQASLSTTNSWSLPKLMSIESVMPSNHLILCRPLVLLPSSFPSIRVFSNESALHIKWPKYWSFSFNISPSNGLPGLIFTMDWLDLLAVQGTLKSLIQPQDNPKFNIHLHYHLHFFLHFAFLQS